MLPPPSRAIVERASAYFRNSFPLSAQCTISREEFERKIGQYYWHYPFEFDGRLVDSNHPDFRGLRGRHYLRYMHIFPALLSLTGGTLSGKSVLDVACNAGFWAIQAKLAGADPVVGVEASPENVEQANLILELTGLHGIAYREMNAYDISPVELGTFNVTLFLGLLYHLDDPILALRRLHDVTQGFAVVDTSLARSHRPVLRLAGDSVHDQNYSNGLALQPSRGAVVLMLRYVGFREVVQVGNTRRDLPRDYLKGTRATFIAMK